MGSIFDDYREMKVKKEKKHNEEPRFKIIGERFDKVKISRKGYSNKPSGKAKSSIGSVLRKL